MSTEAHVRIDEGLKRGPRQTPVRISTENVPRAINSNALRDVEPQSIIQAIMAGERARDIAQRLECSTPAIYQHLLKYAEADWRNAQVAKALALRDKAEEDLEVASDALSLARARETLKSAQWSLERLLSRLYGDKQDTAPKLPPILIINLPGASPLTLEHEPK